MKIRLYFLFFSLALFLAVPYTMTSVGHTQIDWFAASTPSATPVLYNNNTPPVTPPESEPSPPIVDCPAPLQCTSSQTGFNPDAVSPEEAPADDAGGGAGGGGVGGIPVGGRNENGSGNGCGCANMCDAVYENKSKLNWYDIIPWCGWNHQPTADYEACAAACNKLRSPGGCDEIDDYCDLQPLSRRDACRTACNAGCGDNTCQPA